MKNIKLNKHLVVELVKRGVRVTLAGATLAFTLIMSTGCTEEELNQANEIIEQLQQGGQEEITPEVKPVEPGEQDPIEVIPVEPEVIEPIEVEPENVSPIYTEEEIAEAKEKIASKEKDFDNASSRDDFNATCEEVKEDYYKVNREIGEIIYQEVKDISVEEITKGFDAKYYYYDEGTNYIYSIDFNGVCVNGIKDDMYFEVYYSADGSNFKNVVGDIEYAGGYNIGLCVAPKTLMCMNSQSVLKECTVEKNDAYNKAASNFQLSKDEFCKYGYNPTTYENENVMVK